MLSEPYHAPLKKKLKQSICPDDVVSISSINIHGFSSFFGTILGFLSLFPCFVICKVCQTGAGEHIGQGQVRQVRYGMGLCHFGIY